MVRNPVYLSLYNFKQKKSHISAEFTPLIVAVFEKISVEYTSRISSLSPSPFTVKKFVGF